MLETIGRFTIEEKIGEGAMADVYRAHDPNIDRALAFKVLKKERLGDDEYVTRFLREARAAGALSHPNIVTVFDVGEVDDLPFIAMELLDGHTLEDLMNEDQNLPIETVILIGIQLGSALDYAHRAGIIHRDIKPGNVIIGTDGQSVKVADFGIARMDDTEATHIGTMLGTPRYMSPEQAEGQMVTGKADLFSVGVILYELLTGQKAFDAKTITGLLAQIIKEQPQSISKTNANVPKGLSQIVERLLEKNPAHRFQSGGELSLALERELRSIKEQALEDKRERYLPLRFKWASIMSGIVLLVMAITGSIIFSKQYDAVERQAIDSGSVLAEFVAAESTLDAARDEWAQIAVFIADAAQRDIFEYIVFVDRAGKVRAASDKTLIGQDYQAPRVEQTLEGRGNVKAIIVRQDNGQRAFEFEAPIVVNSNSLGSIGLGGVHIGLSIKSLEDVAGITRLLLIILAAVTIASVALLAYLTGDLMSRPLKILAEAMRALADGQGHYRISQIRKDEFGQLFDGFNEMAAKVMPASQQPASNSGFDDLFADDVSSSQSTPDAEQSAPPPAVDEDLTPPKHADDNDGAGPLEKAEPNAAQADTPAPAAELPNPDETFVMSREDYLTKTGTNIDFQGDVKPAASAQTAAPKPAESSSKDAKPKSPQ